MEIIVESRPMSNGQNMCSHREQASVAVCPGTLMSEMGPPTCTHIQSFKRVTHTLYLNLRLKTNVASHLFLFYVKDPKQEVLKIST